MNCISKNVGYLTSDRTISGDEKYTPYFAVEPLLKYIQKDKIIWCSCDEEWSAFYNIFKENGYKVIRSSLVENQDFFTYEPQEHWDIIITNPPFSKKVSWVKRCFELGKSFVLLLPLNSLQHRGLFEYFKNSIELLTFDKRVGFHSDKNYEAYENQPPFASAYFCKDVLPEKLIIEELIKYERPLK